MAMLSFQITATVSKGETRQRASHVPVFGSSARCTNFGWGLREGLDQRCTVVVAKLLRLGTRGT
jgi:hypothetical protein